MKLWAISDLHVGAAANRAALETLTAHPDDWLIVAGDVCEKVEMFDDVMELLVKRFAKVFWTPGNHELWSTVELERQLRGVDKYEALVDVCRLHGVATPEDPYLEWQGKTALADRQRVRICPIFTLFDYSFRPSDVAAAAAVAWAAETKVVSNDEILLRPEPFTSRAEWCAARCRFTEERLTEAAQDAKLVLVGHFPLLKELVRLRFIERFVLWCGTTLTRDWHTRFNAACVVYGHLHTRNTEWRDGVRFEEVSLGMPRQWDPARTLDSYLREIFPGPAAPASGNQAPMYRP